MTVLFLLMSGVVSSAVWAAGGLSADTPRRASKPTEDQRQVRASARLQSSAGEGEDNGQSGEKAPAQDEANGADDGKQDQSADDSKDAGEKSKDAKPEQKTADARASDEKAKKTDAAEKKKHDAYEVEAKDLKIEVEAEGVFVAEDSVEVALRPEVWSSFKVLEAVPHGKRVRKGDVLVKFDDKDIDKAIADKSLELRMGELALMAAEEEFPRTEKSIVLNYDQSKREYEQAVNEKKRFDETMRDLSERMAKQNLDSSEQQYANASEELEQLQKMYDADELTEETEEIVLKRQKFAVDSAKFYYEYAKVNHEYTMDVAIPQREEALKTDVEFAKIAYDRASMAKSLGMNQKRYELEKLRETRAKEVDNHAKLLADRALMTIKSPADGIVYYGRCVNGRWVEVGNLESKLTPYGTAPVNAVLMTIVEDRPLYVETAVGEKELPAVKPKQPATVAPTADAEIELSGSVVQTADVPGAGNKFSVRIDVQESDEPDWLMPGMTCKAKITVYDVDDAIVIPIDLVQTDEKHPKRKYVMLQVEGEEEPVRLDLKLGKKKDQEVEVLKGLKAGDKILKGAKADDESEEKDKK